MPKRIIKKVFFKASRTRKFTGTRHKKTGTFDKITGTVHGGGGDIFKAGAGGSLAGSYIYDRIKEKKDKMRK